MLSSLGQFRKKEKKKKPGAPIIFFFLFFSLLLLLFLSWRAGNLLSRLKSIQRERAVSKAARTQQARGAGAFRFTSSLIYIYILRRAEHNDAKHKEEPSAGNK